MRLWVILAVAVLGWACTPNDSGVEGTLLFGERPLADAQVEIYLKSGQDRSVAPFAVAVTDERGRYRLDLPPGRYYLIGKKREEGEDGRDRMLMAECPINPVEVKGRERVPPFGLREMGRGAGLVPDPGTAVQGRVVGEAGPVEGAWVYVYMNEDAGLMGPSYAEAVRTGAAGSFRIPLPAGSYYLAARQRGDGSRLGEPAPGDLNGVYGKNPVAVPLGQEVELEDLRVAAVDLDNRVLRRSEGKFASTDTAFTGRVVDGQGNSQAGIYVFAYLDRRMVGKPTYISEPSDAQGRFILYLTEGGTYYIGARSRFGGPLEPGERVGTYAGRADHGADIERGTQVSLGDLRVREVW
ncbi:carboxypeptidase-like regulatory domain-containing protein [Geoalkalibacter halelectricus]|uniref:carboxypeptidase-like regulatory domain-containing protein n=1 Tax=Geoalkalibacter halelectricus TaxID=2847045 RepID=UPI0026703B95|nr:carboxypeptidase-like regulatory domain-containing protein [Geoalkalibacter halelectricus]MDO3378759.1 carboxypeptidase-like regulatory domain-containing protein [Geoalkalibacter halelectricus]